ncbi:MAG: hypothetical protein IT355_10920 [Gemmatimonadaceae bacterium]|nr:hypothetical protein [Gemmatimonadaceae bacterium]
MSRFAPNHSRLDEPARSKSLRRGFALESTLLLIVLFGALIGVATTAIAVYSRTAGVEVRAARVQYAAEGAGDQLMAQLDAAMADGVVSPADITSLTTPTLPGFTFTQSTSYVGGAAMRIITRGAFSGLYALEQPMKVSVTADDAGGNRAAIELGVLVQAVPVFQFGVFAERDLEITNGPPMTFVGWVHSNRNIYLSSANADYMSQVTAADSVFWMRKDTVSRLPGVRIANASGTLMPLDFDSRSHPGAAFVAQSNTVFDGRLMSGESGVRRLQLPLPTGMDPIELIRPALVGDTPEVRGVRMANKADLRIVVNLAAPLTNVCTEATFVRTGGRAALAGACPGILQFARDAFYDGREMRSPDVLELDVAALRAWVNANVSSRQVNVLYVEFQNRDTLVAGRDYPALRLKNGWELPAAAPGEVGGMTVSTNSALYVQGDYNTTNWKPASLLGDVATFLSNAWADDSSAVFPRPRTFAATTVYAALLAGNSETPCDAMNCGTQPYGGGFENFPRFLEDWGGSTGGTQFQYRGSLVALFTSRQSSRPWGHGLNMGFGYYNPPSRDWAFETRFSDPQFLPPGTPSLGAVVQVSYRSVF